MPQLAAPDAPSPARAPCGRALFPAGARIPRIAWTGAIMPRAWLTKPWPRADVPVLRNAASLTGPSPRSPVPRSTSSPSSIWPRHPHRRSPTAQSPDLRLVFRPVALSGPQLASSILSSTPVPTCPSSLPAMPQLPAPHAPPPAPPVGALSSRGRTDSHHCTSPLNISLWLTDPFRRRRRAQRPPDEEGEVDLIGRDRWPRSGARHEKGAG